MVLLSSYDFVSAKWRDIELSESYLVCCMFEEAASLAISILRHLCNSDSTKMVEHVQLDDMMESASMVLVQSFKELGRTSELFNELKALFGSVTAIPSQALLTGACFQISEGYSSGLQTIFEEFLGQWKYVNGQYVLADVESQRISEGCIGCSVLGINKYLEVTELYAVTLLGKVLRDTELAVIWLEKAELPEEERQNMLRRLQSLCSLNDPKSYLGPGTPEIEEISRDRPSFGTAPGISETDGFSGMVDAKKKPNGKNTVSTILKTMRNDHSLVQATEPCFWWFRTVTLKFGNARLVLSRGRIVLWSSFILLSYYIIRRKGPLFKRIATRQAASVKRALIDAWQLAFSMQVNPLAAVQPLPVGTRSGGN